MVVGLGDIGKLLGPAMPDPRSISNNAYSQCSQCSQWGGPIQQTNVSGVIGLGSAIGGVTTGGVTTQGTPLQYYLPPATGITLTMVFVDANGIAMTIIVDQSYTGIMSQISNLHQMKSVGMGVRTYYPPPIKNDGPIFKQKTEPMVGDDFSYDEMELAETIIEELESGREARQQEDICNLA